MKPATAAKKLDVYLPATPAEFQQNAITRDELAALQTDQAVDDELARMKEKMSTRTQG